MVVTPSSRWRSAIWARVDTRSVASRLDSGSSMHHTLGLRTIERPMATRCRWPPDMAAGRLSMRGPSSSMAAARSTRCSISARSSFSFSSAKDMFCRAVMLGYRA